MWHFLLAILFHVVGGVTPQKVDLLTIGATPVQQEVAAGDYYRFKVDMINDYCGKADIVARKLCMKTPQMLLTLKNCRGATWLLANPSKLGEPVLGQEQFISKKGNTSNYVEVIEFPLTQTVTHIAVYHPGKKITGFAAPAVFQIWITNTLDKTILKKIKPVMRPGDQWFQLGRLIPTVRYSGSIFIPSKVVISFERAIEYSTSGAATNHSLEYRLYYTRLGHPSISPSADKNPAAIMSSTCGVLLNAKGVGNWTSFAPGLQMNSTHTMHIDGGRYLFNVLARSTQYDFPIFGNQCMHPCLVGAYETLPFKFNPFKPVAGTDTKEFKLALTILLSSFGVLGMVVVIGFLYISKRAKAREEAKTLMNLQEERRASIERGEKYKTTKKKRKLTCWERITGEVVTKEDEDYDDCLNPQERAKIEQFKRAELGADSNLDTRDIPAV